MSLTLSSVGKRLSHGVLRMAVTMAATCVLIAAFPLCGVHAQDVGQWEIGKPVSLFDGKTLNGWTTGDGKPVTRGWTVKDGAIHRASGGGNIFFHKDVGDFELSFQWKIDKGGNNGIKYRVRRFGGQMLGCEYQMLGETSPSFSIGSAGSLYVLYEPNKNKKLNPPGEWNTAKIVAHGPHIEHWMNGKKIVEAEVGSEEWMVRHAKSKFAPHYDFARNNVGKLMITDHGSKVWYRDMVLTPLAKREIPKALRPNQLATISEAVKTDYGLDVDRELKAARAHNILFVGTQGVSEAAVAEAGFQVHRLMSAMRLNLGQRIRGAGVIWVVRKDSSQSLKELGLGELKRRNQAGTDDAFVGYVGDRAVVVVTESEVLGYPDAVRRENAVVHAFGQLTYELVLDARLRKRLETAFKQAKAAGKWESSGARLVERDGTEPKTLEKVLATAFPDQSASALSAAIAAGRVHVNGEPAESKQSVSGKDQVTVVHPGPSRCLAGTDPLHYWVEGVQSWFNANAPADQHHNGTSQRQGIKKYDAVLAKLCQDVLRDMSWDMQWASHRVGNGREHLDGVHLPVAERAVIAKSWSSYFPAP